ncbi:MAG: ATP-binding cassette domain-containing protein [Cellulomonadaceae bacterium]|jgi:ABC-2 type transport system ATP-binding protein|nr:ATP-binding cassette domain-containing protein [Cellulomonadaceae bacterium]
MAVLDVAGLTKAYGDLRALDGVSFRLEAGELFGFVGSNGAGKTTTMRIILGVLTADAGTVTWDGAPIDFAGRRRIGYMPEERGLYPKMRVGEQLEYLARLHGLDASAAVTASKRWAETLGIDARYADEVQQLSLGNQQRVQLAAALVHSPDLLVLDEPFSGLDPVAVDVMSGVLQERAAAGVPVIFSSHQLDLVERLCDRVGIIRDGKMVAQGTIADLRHTDTPQWMIDGPTGDGWLSSLPGVRLISQQGARTVVEYSNTDGNSGSSTSGEAAIGQTILRAALAAGPVTEFAPLRPSLTEIYRHEVSTTEESAAHQGNGDAR